MNVFDVSSLNGRTDPSNNKLQKKTNKNYQKKYEEKK